MFIAESEPAPAKNKPTPTTDICQLIDTSKNPIIATDHVSSIVNFRPKLSAKNEKNI
jgi:hypothetical protein